MHTDDFSTIHRHAYFETTYLLLEAGSITRMSGGLSPLDFLLNASIFVGTDDCEIFVKHISRCIEALPLLVDILELLLKHRVQLTLKEGDSIIMVILKVAATLAKAVDVPQRLDHLRLTFERALSCVNRHLWRHASFPATCWGWKELH